MTNISIPTSCKSISSHAFYNCQELLSISIPNSVSKLEDYTFFNCYKLQSIKIPASLTSITIKFAFYKCISLSTFEIDEDNPKYDTDKNKSFLLSKDLNTCYMGPATINVTFPSSVKIIAPYCFNSRPVKNMFFPNSNLQIIQWSAFRQVTVGDIIFPEGLQEIQSQVFEQSYVDSITIPDSVKIFNTNALTKSFKIGNLFFSTNSSVLVQLEDTVYDINKTNIIFISPNATSIHITNTVQFIASELVRAHNIINVSTDDGGCYGSDKNGLHYTSNMTILLACPGGKKEAIVNTSCIQINDAAFLQTLVEKVVLPDSIRKIGNTAFNQCYNLSDINIPNSLIYLESYAFASCLSLPKLKFGPKLIKVGPYAFSNSCSQCIDLNDTQVTELSEAAFYYTNISEIILPYNLKTINASVFVSCVKLESIVIPSKTTTVLKNTFQYCNKLKSVIINGPLKLFPDSMFEWTKISTITIPDSVESIGTNCFKHCNALEEVLISDSSCLKTIESGIIYNTPLLKCFKITSNVSTIREGAFARSIGLLKFEVSPSNAVFSAPDGILLSDSGQTLHAFPGGLNETSVESSITSIFSQAFYECLNLVKINFTEESQISVIKDSTFYGCSSLLSLKLPGSIKTIEGNAFKGCANISDVIFGDFSKLVTLGESSFAGCSRLATVRFGKNSSLQSVASGVFEGCNRLSEFDFPDSLLKIEKSAFSGCTQLSTVRLTSIQIIGQNAFQGCKSLVSIILPSSLLDLGQSSFDDCTNLRKVIYCGNSTNSKLQTVQAFNNCPLRIIEVTPLFEGTKFGGVGVEEMLDSHCYYPTYLFTSDPTNVPLNVQLLIAFLQGDVE